MFAAFHKESPRITMLFILLNETKSLLNTEKILWAAILDHVWHQNYFFLLFSRLHDQTLYQCHARKQEVAKGSNICLWCKMLNENVIDLDQMSKVILPTHISVEIRKGSKERRKGGNGLRLSFLSFPCSLAFRHQSFTLCPPRFAFASVRKTKRLRRRQRLNGKAHSSKAMLDERVWSFSLGLTTESTSGWNLFRRCCHFTLLSYSWFMKIRNFPAASTQEPWEWDRSDSSFPSFDGWRHVWSTAHAARCKIFTIFGEECRYDHMDLEGF